MIVNYDEEMRKVLESMKDAPYDYFESGCSFCGEAVAWALKTIDSQRAEIERLQPKWIPVSERMPETGERVLVLDAFLPSFNVMRVDYRNSEKQKTFACSHRATYWMPLPNPPLKDGDGE